MIEAALPHLTNEDRLRNIVRTYRKCASDEQARIPTRLMLLIEAAALALQDQENHGAEAGIRSDQRDRLDGRPESFGVSACSRSHEAGR